MTRFHPQTIGSIMAIGADGLACHIALDGSHDWVIIHAASHRVLARATTMKKAQAAIEKVLTVSQAQHIDWTQSVVDLSFDQQTPVDEAWQDLRREGMIK